MSTLTRANAEYLLLRRVGRVMAVAGLDGTHDSGDNQDLVDPLSWAIRQLKGTVAAAETVTDADLATVDNVDALLDFAEFRALQNTSAAYILVDTSRDGNSRRDGQLANHLDRLVEQKRQTLLAAYGMGLQPLTVGIVDLGISQPIPSGHPYG